MRDNNNEEWLCWNSKNEQNPKWEMAPISGRQMIVRSVL